MKKKVFLILGLIFAVILGVWGFNNPRNQIQTSLIAPTPPISPKPLLTFSVIGDPESDLDNLKKALAMSKNNGDKFTVLVGDLTHVGAKKELKEVKQVLDESSLKYYAVPGNHDIYSAKKLTGNPTQYFEEIIGSPYGEVLVYIGAALLLIDNSDEELGISAKQMEFIKDSLLPDKGHIFIFLHIPVYHPDSTYLMGYGNAYVSKQKDELLNKFHNASVSAFFSGHLHHTSISEKDNLKFYVAGSVSSQRNWQTPRFLEVEVFEEGKFSVDEVEVL